MALDLTTVNGYGTGALGEVTNPSGQINSYARVTAIDTPGTTLTIGTAANGAYETFAVGKEVLFHVSGCLSTVTDQIGKFIVAKITAVNGSNITLDKSVNAACNATQLASYACQVVTIAQFKKLIAPAISALAYNVTNYYGGILAVKVSDTLDVSAGGSLLSNGSGIPTTNSTLRLATPTPNNAESKNRLVLNRGNGIVFLLAAKTLGATTARIGGSAAGSAKTAGGAGGATIFFVTGTSSGLNSTMFSTGAVTSGVGNGTCYVATLDNDESVYDELHYAHDLISNTKRLDTYGFKGFGSGDLGQVTNPSGQINSYARVTGMSSDGRVLTVGTMSNGAYTAFSVGSEVLFHVSACAGTETSQMGKWFLAKILAVSGSQITIEKGFTSIFAPSDLSKYYCQLISVPNFNNLTVDSANSVSAKIWDNTNNIGGILVLKAKNTLDITNGKLLSEGAGLPIGSTKRPAGMVVTNCDAPGRLPLNQGHGNVFLFGNLVKMSANTRIGAKYTGAFGAGKGAVSSNIQYSGNDGTPGQGGNTGISRDAITPLIGGFIGYSGQIATVRGAINYYTSTNDSNGAGDDMTNPPFTASAGANIMLAADTISGFVLDAISTGGATGASWNLGRKMVVYGNAGAGFGGGAGFGDGGGSLNQTSPGGGPGQCYIACNNFI